MTSFSYLLNLLLFILPAYIANAVPVLLGGGAPLDLGNKFSDGERLLGEGKTIRGFIAGVAGGTVVAGILAFYYSIPFFADSKAQMLAGFMMSLGTMVGDALGSYIKRRFKVGSGKQFILDSTMFLFVALVFAYSFIDSNVLGILPLFILLVATLILHPTTNFIANKLGLKKVPW